MELEPAGELTSARLRRFFSWNGPGPYLAGAVVLALAVAFLWLSLIGPSEPMRVTVLDSREVTGKLLDDPDERDFEVVTDKGTYSVDHTVYIFLHTGNTYDCKLHKKVLGIRFGESVLHDCHFAPRSPAN